MTKKEFEEFVTEMSYVIHTSYLASNPNGGTLSTLITKDSIYITNDYDGTDKNYPINIKIESLSYKKKHAANE